MRRELAGVRMTCNELVKENARLKQELVDICTNIARTTENYHLARCSECRHSIGDESGWSERECGAAVQREAVLLRRWRDAQSER